jgi:hypothetical protein
MVLIMTDIIIPPDPGEPPPPPPPTLYYVDVNGNYIGGFSGAEPPEGSIEVPTAPDDARQKWLNGAWQPVVDDQITNSPADLFGGPTLGEIFNGDG